MRKRAQKREDSSGAPRTERLGFNCQAANGAPVPMVAENWLISHICYLHLGTFHAEKKP
ncbi:hypothetical protein PAMP_001977 [Pampus punctatissimus]